MYHKAVKKFYQQTADIGSSRQDLETNWMSKKSNLFDLQFCKLMLFNLVDFLKFLYCDLLQWFQCVSQFYLSFKGLINPFFPNSPFLYPLKTSENRKVFYFQGLEKECTGNKCVKIEILLLTF